MSLYITHCSRTSHSLLWTETMKWWLFTRNSKSWINSICCNLFNFQFGRNGNRLRKNPVDFGIALNIRVENMSFGAELNTWKNRYAKWMETKFERTREWERKYCRTKWTVLFGQIRKTAINNKKKATECRQRHGRACTAVICSQINANLN